MLDKYFVEINYKKGPSFSAMVESDNTDYAKVEANRLAKQFGFNDKIKSFVVRDRHGYQIQA